MNTPNPAQPDPSITPEINDELDAELLALLAEDAQQTRISPQALEAKILALTDPQMLSLLDEALAPEQAPDQLSERIIAATMPNALASKNDVPERAVLARIEPTTWRYAAAAAVVLAAGVGMWWLGQSGNTTDKLAENPDEQTPLGQLFAQAEAENEPLFDDATEAVQAKIQTVSERIDNYAIDRDAIWSDMDGYEQFLADLES